MATSILAGQATLADVNVMDEFPVVPKKSELDYRDYRVIRLPNGLTAALVHDEKAADSAASLSVNVGQYDDPVEWDGMAHFLEHMLFLGTEKYPDTDEYKRFIDQNAGSSNAYTADDHTNYYFSVRHEAMEEALDRFSRFFIDPLFDADYTNRERHAIQSEYNTRKSSTMRRILAAAAQVVNPEHRGAHYGIGTLESLRDREDVSARDAVARFFDEHYSAHRMNLSVVTNQPLDTVEAWVRQSFADVARRATVTRDKTLPIFADGALPLRLNVTPIDNKHNMILQFPVPHERTHWLQRPGNYLSHLIGDEGPGSVFQYLNTKGWVKSLSASPFGLFESNDTALFTVQIGLTDEGISHYKDVISSVFSYIELVRQQGLAGWRFDEIKRTTEFSFELFQSNSSEDLAMYLANNLEHTAPHNILYHNYQLGQFDETLMVEYLERLRPENMSLIIASPDVAVDTETPLWEAPYHAQTISKAELAAFIGDTVEELALPEANPYIPDGVVARNTIDVDKPIRLDEEALVWMYPTTAFPGARAELNAHFRVDELFRDAAHEAAANLLVDMVRRELNTLTYPAVVAGINAKVRISDRGYDINIAGYSQHQGRLFELIIEQLFNGEFDKAAFEFARNNAIQQVVSWRRDTPYYQLYPMLSAIALKDNYLKPERLTTLERMDYDQFKALIDDIRSVNSIRLLIVGDVLEDDARAILARMREEIVDNKPLLRLGVRQLQGAEDVRWQVDNSDSAVIVGVQALDSTIATRVAFSLASMLAQPQIYTELRTNQQLGYVVQNTTMPLAGVPHMVTLLQTTVISAEEAVDRVRAATIDALEALQMLDENTFAEAKKGFIAQLRSNPQSLGEVMDRYWYDIVSNYPNFDQNEQLARSAQQMSLAEFKQRAAEVVQRFQSPLQLMAVGDAHAVNIEGYAFNRQRVEALPDFERAAVGK